MSHYIVTFPGGTDAYAIDHGNFVGFDHGISAVTKRAGENAAQAIRRVYPHVSIFSVAALQEQQAHESRKAAAESKHEKLIRR